MIKNLIIFIIAFLVLIVLVVTYTFKTSPTKALTLEDVKVAISQAQYCETKDDCVEVSSKCPFGCSVFVNQAERQSIQDLINAYDGPDCVYGCVEVKGYDCISNKCSILF